MAVTLKGGTLTTKLAPGDKLRCTWRMPATYFLPAFLYDTAGVDAQVREALPAQGFVPVSAPNSVHGSEVFVIDVRISQTPKARTMSDAVNFLDNLAVPAAISLVELEKVTAAETSAQAAANIDKQTNAAKDAAAKDSLDEDIKDKAKDLWKEITGILKPVFVVAAIGGGIYLYVKFGKK